MDIMLINHYAGSNDYGMEFRPYLLAKQWAKMGHNVTIVAATYSHLRKVNPVVTKDFEEEKKDGITYVWVKTPSYHGNGAGRVINVLTAVKKLNKNVNMLAKKYHPEYVIASSTYPYDIYPAKKIADITGGKLFFEIHDLWPLTQIEVHGLKETNPFIKSLQKAEDFCYKNADVISILSDADKHIRERGFTKTKFTHVPNGIEPLPESELLPLPQNAECIKKLKADGKKIFMYIGGFARANALAEFIKSAKLLENDCEIVLVGDGKERPELTALAEAQNVKNIHFTGSVNKLEVPAVLKLADILYIGAKRIPLYRYGVGMNKLYDYMYAGKPVICGIEAPGNPIALSGCGVVIEPENENAIAEAAKTLLSKTNEELLLLGQKGYNYVMENNNYKTLAERFLQALRGEI